MNSVKSLQAAAFALAISAGLAALPATTAGAEPAPPSDVIEVTRQEVDASNAKVQLVYDALTQMWSADFQKIGDRFAAPQLARYRSPIRTPCGVMMPNNAGYCYADNTIYFDDVFVTAQEKAAARALGTDGDMAGLGIIAHEMGHAVAMQLGDVSRVSYQNEATADCLAGAFAQHSSKDGSLEKGDVEEAEFGMASAGDPTPELTGNQRVDQRILAHLAADSHGTREQRVQNFRTGFTGGAGACVAQFQGITT
jgi:predicted metalloprotease